ENWFPEIKFDVHGKPVKIQLRLCADLYYDKGRPHIVIVPANLLHGKDLKNHLKKMPFGQQFHVNDTSDKIVETVRGQQQVDAVGKPKTVPAKKTYSLFKRFRR
ncbi:MAG: hypothetical protein V1847_04820, partial [Candidatus Diapherotrites archaeon]